MNKEKIIQKYKPEMENLILILTEIQDQTPNHYIKKEDMIWVADYLNITWSAVYGVVKYYTMFSTEPKGRYVIRVCNSPVCDMMDGHMVFESLEAILGIKSGEVTDDGLFSIEGVECLGHCEKAPAMLINESVYGRLTREKIHSVIDSLKNEIKRG